LTDPITFIFVCCGIALIVALVVALYDYFFGPLAWAPDSDVFGLMDQWILHPIARQIDKVYPIYEDDEYEGFGGALPWEEVREALESEDPLLFANIDWDFPTFRPEKRPWDHERDGF
jgi:hypothetical protein